MKRMIILLVVCLTGLNIFNRVVLGTQEKTGVSTSLFRLKQNDRYGYIDKTGRVVIKPQFEKADDLSEGLDGVRVDSKWGYIDNLGEIVINPQFHDAGPFTDGLARDRLYGEEELKEGFIDKTGKVVIQPTFGYANNFSNGIAEVGMWQNSGYIDKNGQLINSGQLIWAESVKEASKPPSAVPFERPPAVSKRVAPKFPEIARKAGLEGEVWVYGSTKRASQEG